MTSTNSARIALKRACMDRLSRVAVEHPAGHQGKLAARFILRTPSGERIELMFEKGDASSANLWVCKRFVIGLLDADIPYRYAPGSAAFKVRNADGKPVYGRHSALKTMDQLATDDLICFGLRTVGDLDAILFQLREQP